VPSDEELVMMVSGPVSGGSHGWPFGGPGVDLAARGYVQEEYFLDGTASRFARAPGSELGWDGRWTVEPAGTAPYRTRLLVVRPADPAAFNGTLLVFWNNVSAGYEHIGGGESAEIFEGGYAYVAVTAQRVGVHGVPPTPQGLRAWDPDRYGTLSIPSDDYSYDIFTQAATAVSPGRPATGADPLGGLAVRRMIATGGSQSAARLATYLNAVQPTAGVFDGFQLLLYFGGGAPLEAGDAVMTVQAAASDPSSPRIAEGTHLLRDDLDLPVMVVNTECEALSCYRVRQPDTERYRYWEVAGASHVSWQGIQSSAPRLERDFGFVMPIDGDTMAGINRVSAAPVVDAALHHMDRWLRDGTAPPVQPLIDFEGEPPAVVRDGDGIAQGGIRLPAVAVPVAHNSAIQKSPDVLARLVGSHEPFSAERLHELYPSRAEYLERVEKAARAAEADLVVLPRDVEPMVSEAAAAWPV
jgi:Alpha/beta hydrolase domain